MAFLTPNYEPGISSRLILIPDYLLPSVIGALLEGTYTENWEIQGTATPEKCSSDFLEVIDSMSETSIGEIRAAVGPVPLYGLLCDGGWYSKDDYPSLYSLIDSTFKDPLGFHVPDLRDRFIMGGNVPGVVGGEASHTLTIDEMPPHEHGGHTHVNVETSGEIPDPLSGPTIPDILDTRGGGQPHNNLPPFLTVRFFIIAR